MATELKFNPAELPLSGGVRQALFAVLDEDARARAPAAQYELTLARLADGIAHYRAGGKVLDGQPQPPLPTDPVTCDLQWAVPEGAVAPNAITITLHGVRGV